MLYSVERRFFVEDCAPTILMVGRSDKLSLSASVYGRAGIALYVSSKEQEVSAARSQEFLKPRLRIRPSVWDDVETFFNGAAARGD